MTAHCQFLWQCQVTSHYACMVYTKKPLSYTLVVNSLAMYCVALSHAVV